MKPNNADVSMLQNKSFQSSNLSKMGMESIFCISHTNYIREFNLYMGFYNIVPNLITIHRINCRTAHSWFLDRFTSEINETYYNKHFFRDSNSIEFDDIFHFLEQDMMIYFSTSSDVVHFMFRNTEMLKVNELIAGIKKFKNRRSRNQPKISLLVTTENGIEIKQLKINRTKLNILDNYNDDFSEIHQTILKRLSKKNDKGLVLLHGKPGTGKTSYIRHLVSRLNKDLIFLPPNMAISITDPAFLGIMIDHPNTIIVIEDAENIVIDREKNGNSPVSALLNISDGLLADCLNIQIICSFNTDISKVDSALMRKGRMIANYEFKPLEINKARQLSNKLGFDTIITEPMTLAAIYNQAQQNFEVKKSFKSIGFKVSA